MPTDFHALKKFFNATNIDFRTWRLKKSGSLQEYHGDVIVIGDSDGAGPYTQFCFDEEGALVEAGCHLDTNKEQVAVDVVGGTKRTVFDYDTMSTIEES